MDQYTYEDLRRETKGLVRSTWATSLSYILLGLTLTAILAWAFAVHATLDKYLPYPSRSPVGATIYAVVVTLLVVIAYQFVGDVLHQPVPTLPVGGIVEEM